MRIKSEFLVKPAIVALGLVCVTAFWQGPVSAEDTQEVKPTEERVQERTQTQEQKPVQERVRRRSQTRWGAQAERTFGLGRGLAPKLMTQDEWTEHHRKMRTMTPEEREQYRKEVHQQMVERAKERGIALPAPLPAPIPPGGGSGPGTGGGTGSGTGGGSGY